MTDTQLAPRTELWNTMPGWGIVANLLPPEIITARRVKSLRKAVVCALIGIVVLSAGGWGYGYWQVHKASSALSAQEAKTTELIAEQNKYDVVVEVQDETAHVDTQLAGLLTDDVNVPRLVAAVIGRSPMPSGLSQVQVNITAADLSSSTSTVSATGTVLNPSGHAQIGTVTIGGVVRSMNDVATYVDRLAQIPGFVEVMPLSQLNDGKRVTYSISLIMTDQLVSGRSAALTAAASSGGN